MKGKFAHLQSYTDCCKDRKEIPFVKLRAVKSTFKRLPKAIELGLDT